MFTDDFIDDEPTAAAYAPDLLFVVQHAHAARLFNSFTLSRIQLHRRGRQRFPGENGALRLINGEVLHRKIGWGNQRGNRQGNESEFRFRHGLKIKSDSQTDVVFLVLITKDVAVVRSKYLVILTECLADRQLMKESYGGPPAFPAIMNRRSHKV